MSEIDENSPVPMFDEGTEMVLRGDTGYPSRLELLSDPPPRLYVRGSITELPMVAIVGTREADGQMRRLVSGLAAELVSRGLVVISGGARGIDTAAHEGALEAGGATVAVIGSGFNHMYPEINRQLFARIEVSGAVLTEFEADTPPTRWTFPRRNRLVAAMASAVVVAQAGERSGALITARIARDLGISLGAVPGAAGDPRSRGCNQLIRAGAVMVEDVTDVLALLEGEAVPRQLDLSRIASGDGYPRCEALAGLSAHERTVLDRLGSTPVHIDDIASGAGLSASDVLAAVLNLELAGLVEDRGGKAFIRVG